MKWKMYKLLTLSCVLLIAVFLIPITQYSMSTPVLQSNMLSTAGTSSSKGGSIEWNISLNNAIGQAIAVTQNESYIYVGGAYWTDPTNSSTWKPTLWKYTNSGSQVWSTGLDVQNYFTIVAFRTLALSPDESAIYAGGQIPNATSYCDGVVAKFNASDGSPIWNYTLSGLSFDYIYSIAAAPDDSVVYFAGLLSKSTAAIYYNTSFYVGAVNSNNGTLRWEYELYLNGSYDVGYANDLALSPDGDVLYASGYYTFWGWSNITRFVALDTTTGSQLWNLTSTTYYSIYDIDISSNGMVYALSSVYPSYNIITINTSNQSITGNVSISNPINPYGLSLSFNESCLYVPTNRLEAYGQSLHTLMVEIDFSGTVTSTLLSPNSQLAPRDLAPSNDNTSAYIVASRVDPLSYTYSMWLIKGQAGPIPLPALPFILLFYLLYSEAQAVPTKINSVLTGIGITVALVLMAVLISKKLRGEQEIV